jgi:hypothetical protein
LSWPHAAQRIVISWLVFSRERTRCPQRVEASRPLALSARNYQVGRGDRLHRVSASLSCAPSANSGLDRAYTPDLARLLCS